MNNSQVRIDPRTELLLLVMANIAAFTYSLWWMEFVIVASLYILLVYAGCIRPGTKWLSLYAGLLIIQYGLIPVMPQFLVIMFSILTVYLRRLFPCILVGVLIVNTTPVRYIIIALRKWHIPQKLIIPLSITLRYFPAIKEEHRYIRDAIKLKKKTNLAKRIEYTIVSFLMSATSTADELSAAAITRGIENPIKKTCIVDLRFHVKDYICLILGLGITLTAAGIR